MKQLKFIANGTSIGECKALRMPRIGAIVHSAGRRYVVRAIPDDRSGEQVNVECEELTANV